MAEKRKNDERSRFQWWLLVIGFALGVLLMIGVQRASAPASTYAQGEFELTATQIIREATQMANPPAEIEGIAGTATQMVREATQTAVSSTGTASP